MLLFAVNNLLNLIVLLTILFGVLAAILLTVLLVRWSVADAKLRGKSPLLVALAVVFFFPWGLLAWLIFRPEPLDSNNSKRSLRLEDYRIQ